MDYISELGIAALIMLLWALVEGIFITWECRSAYDASEEERKRIPQRLERNLRELDSAMERNRKRNVPLPPLT